MSTVMVTLSIVILFLDSGKYLNTFGGERKRGTETQRGRERERERERE